MSSLPEARNGGGIMQRQAYAMEEALCRSKRVLETVFSLVLGSVTGSILQQNKAL